MKGLYYHHHHFENLSDFAKTQIKMNIIIEIDHKILLKWNTVVPDFLWIMYSIYGSREKADYDP